MMFLIDALLSEDPTATEWLFLVSAVFGTIFFAVKILFALVAGIGDEIDFDSGGADAELDPDLDFDSDHPHETTEAFRLYSVNALFAFFMMFGWSGLAAHVQFGLGVFASICIALVIGGAAMMIIAWLLMMVRRLASPGAAFTMQSVVGKEAEVYERISADGRGKVHVYINGILRELDATTENGGDIESFTTVLITGLNGQSGVVVSPISAE